MEQKRYRIHFKGMVQGVGFRWRARTNAQMLGLTGWVQNLWDGSVLMEVQGPERAIDRLLAEIDRGSFIHIDSMEKTALPLDESESMFRVKGY